MEELQKTQEYPKEREQERRRAQQPHEGEERRRRNPNIEDPVQNPDGTNMPVSPEDGTGRR